MKKMMLFFFLTLLSTMCRSQTVQINFDPGRGIGSIASDVTGINQTLNTASTLTSLTTFNFSSTVALAPGHKLVVSCTGVGLNTAVTANGDYTNGTKTFAFAADIIGHLIEVKLDSGGGAAPANIVTFTFVKDAPAVVAPAIVPAVAPPPVTMPSMNALLAKIESQYTKTKIGLIEGASAKAEDLQEENPIHIFFDQNGNSLLGTIPQGISNRQYIVHIIYPGYTDVEDAVTYSVKQKTGSFSSALNFLNNGIQNQISTNFHAAIQRRAYDTWKEKTFLLGTATDDLTFEILATTMDTTTNRAVSGVLETYVIKMSPVFHGSFDIGLINSELMNPTYSLTTSPINPAENLVKETNGGKHGLVTVMATFYTSPIILIEKLFEGRTKKRIPSYKLTGRNLLDDHKIYERIYPTVGVSLGDKTFENLFLGLNWELARGLSIFAGGHWGKVNTFDMPGYESGITPVNQQQFDYYTNEEWLVAWAYGVKVDVLIISNLFK